MNHIGEFLDLASLDAHIEAGNISRSPHHEFDLYVLNYTNQAQFSRSWDNETLNCRGLIVDSGGLVVARSWAKFFNHTETAVPKYALTTPPIVTEKMDGSLGIIYQRPDGRFAVATRGSFASDQAVWATQWLTVEMPGFIQPAGVTTLVEIIYPENRIVVDYGDRAELVLLGAINIATGADIPLWEIDWWPGARAEMHTGIGHMDDVYRFATGNEKENDEGIVAVWYRPGEPSFRLKVKHPEYVRLHRIITGINTKRVWEVLASGGDFYDVLDRVPDEFYGWVKGVITDLRNQYQDIEDAVYEQFQIICLNTDDGDRKGFAAKAKATPWPGLMFALLDGKDIERAIWDMIKPKAEKPFADQGEDT